LLPQGFDDAGYEEPFSPERRLALKAGILGIAALAMAGFAGTVGASVLGRPKSGLGDVTPTSDPNGIALDPSASTRPVGAGQGSPAATGAVGADSSPGAATGPVVARMSQLASGRAVTFDDPTSGDPGVLIKLRDGTIVAFDTVCTHAGCTVEYDHRSGYLICPCHGAAFDPAQQAQVIGGPTDQPLAAIPIHVDTVSGRITLTG
jgi:thiosulfate dehydrogenase [quinone] large subunit